MRATFNGFQWGRVSNLPIQPAVQFYLKTQAGWTEKNYIELPRADEPESQGLANLTDISFNRIAC